MIKRIFSTIILSIIAASLFFASGDQQPASEEGGQAALKMSSARPCRSPVAVRVAQCFAFCTVLRFNAEELFPAVR